MGEPSALSRELAVVVEHNGHTEHPEDVAALCDGAAVLAHAGNRVASLALLWAAVGIAPTDVVAHRRLAAALANSGDVDGAAEEYARYIEFVTKRGHVQRAAVELAYGRAALGDVP
ncbi:MAG: hypothetical protein ACRDF0_04990, partial [Candidatus Limnocylindria bacterium]